MFNGFSPETIDFLWGIRMNNNRDWFLPHKPEYVKHLYEPMKALGQDLFQSFLDKPGNLLWNGGQKTPACISRFVRKASAMDLSGGDPGWLPWSGSAKRFPHSLSLF